jgi:hypothetical protein
MRTPANLRSSSDPQPVDPEQLRAARLEAARRTPEWEELEETALVRRAPFLVHAADDSLWTPFRAPTFEAGSARVVANDRVPLGYYLTPDGDIQFVEKVAGTWSQVVERQARKSRAAS